MCVGVCLSLVTRSGVGGKSYSNRSGTWENHHKQLRVCVCVCVYMIDAVLALHMNSSTLVFIYQSDPSEERKKKKNNPRDLSWSIPWAHTNTRPLRPLSCRERYDLCPTWDVCVCVDREQNHKNHSLSTTNFFFSNYDQSVLWCNIVSDETAEEDKELWSSQATLCCAWQNARRQKIN